MAVAYQSVSTTAFGSITSGNSITITKPTGLAVGDIMVAHLSAITAGGANGNWNTPSGWTSLVNQNQDTNANSEARLTVFYKIADSSDVSASDFSFTLNSNNAYCGGALYRISGGGSVIGAIDGESDDTTQFSTNTITPRADSVLLFLTTCADASQTSGSVSTYAITTDNPTWSEAYDFSFNAGVGQPRGVMAGAYASRSAATATGDSSVTFSAHGQNSVGAIVAIEPPLNVNLSMPVGSVTVSGLAPTLTIDLNIDMPVGTITVSGNAPTVSTTENTVWTNESKPSTTWTNES